MRLSSHQVQLATDSQVVFHLLWLMRSPVDPLYHWLRALFYTLDIVKVVLQPRWIPLMANSTADELLRETDREDWSLLRHPAVHPTWVAPWGGRAQDLHGSSEAAFQKESLHNIDTKLNHCQINQHTNNMVGPLCLYKKL